MADQQAEAQSTSGGEVDVTAVPETTEQPDIPAVDHQDPTIPAADATADSDDAKEALPQDEAQPSAQDLLEEDSHMSLSGEPEFDSHDEPSFQQEDSRGQDHSEADVKDEDPGHDTDGHSPLDTAEEQHSDIPEDDTETAEMSSTTQGSEDPDETIHGDLERDGPSRPGSSASRSVHSSEGDGAENSSHNSTEDDVFSDRSPRTSIHSEEERHDADSVDTKTEKGDQSPYVRSRVTSGVSVSGSSVISDQSRLSRYEKDDFVPTSRSKRPAFRSPSSVRAKMMASPTSSLYSSSSRSGKRQPGLPTISRLGSPSVSAHYPSKGRPSPPHFKPAEPAPLVLLHVTLLPLRWAYGEVMNHFEAKKLPPIAFSSEGLKNLRTAWRQLQDRLGDTEMERGILLPHPQNDYEVLEERLLEALELPLRRRARILECGHYLGPSNEMTSLDDIEDDSEDYSDAEEAEARGRKEKRHWCKTCRGDIKYEELGSERVFRIKVYASNGLMSPGAWDACWKEMERVDIEVEPITGPPVQQDLAKLAALFDQEHQQRLDQQAEEQQRLQFEEEQRLRMEEERRQQLEEERQQLEAQRQQFEEERRLSLEESQKKLEEERRQAEKEQRERIEEERRQQFEEERQLLDAQRREFEEQRQGLEEQRRMIEQEQRQHLEDARRQELEEEHRLLDEQRQQLEEARQQFEEERRQRLEEEELRRLQREEEEQKQLSSARSTSRTSFVEDDLASPGLEATSSTDVDGRRRDSERLREIYGTHGRTPSETTATNSSPAIHIHVDSGRQREEEHNSRQLATIPAPPDNDAHTGQVHADIRQPAPFVPPPTPASPSEQAYHRPEGRRRSLDSASLPELVGESMRVLLQDPKNVAIAALVVLIAMLAGQFAKRDDRSVDIYKPPPHQYQHHQLDAREPVGQVFMNTPAVNRIENMPPPPPPTVETVYKTVTESLTPSPPPLVETIYKTVIESSSMVASPSQYTETVYQTVIQPPVQEKPTPIVETVYTTVTESLVQPHPQPTNEALENARELTPNSADPSIDLKPLPSAPQSDDSDVLTSSPTVSELGIALPSPFSSPERDMEPQADSNHEDHKANVSKEAEVTIEIEHIASSIFNPTCAAGEDMSASSQLLAGNVDSRICTGQSACSEPRPGSFTDESEDEGIGHSAPDIAYMESDTSWDTPSSHSASVPSESAAGATVVETSTVRIAETITETVIVTATRTSFLPYSSATASPDELQV